ncbi:MAG: hypothetical protein ABIJ15_07930 [bacterium]
MGSRILFGRIGRRHGLDGEFYVRLFAPVPEKLPKLYIGESPDTDPGENVKEVEVASLRPAAEKWLVRFKEEPEDTAGKYLSAEKWALSGDCFWAEDVAGCKIYDSGGKFIGVADNVESALPQVWLGIKTADDHYLEIPFLKEFVKKVSIEEKKIIADVPDGIGVRS